MKIMVTGASGKIGRHAVAALKAAGHRVTGVDIKPAADGGRIVAVDCTDFGQVMDAFSGVDAVSGRPDAVLHLAGIPAPGLAADQTIFTTNTVSTYNVFSACARLGIHRVVWASSETILGLPFPTPPDFVPLDETHPDRPEWSYSLSKQLGESMADAFVSWNKSLGIVSLRFSNVFDQQDYHLLPSAQARPENRKFNLWGYVDARDCGQACRLALESSRTGHARYIIAASDTLMDIPSAELMQTYYPGVRCRTGIEGYASLLSSQLATEQLGYRPEHGWRGSLS
jgi:nucleoside-diphosphate-sugar epimerase